MYPINITLYVAVPVILGVYTITITLYAAVPVILTCCVHHKHYSICCSTFNTCCVHHKHYSIYAAVPVMTLCCNARTKSVIVSGPSGLNGQHVVRRVTVVSKRGLGKI